MGVAVVLVTLCLSAQVGALEADTTRLDRFDRLGEREQVRRLTRHLAEAVRHLSGVQVEALPSELAARPCPSGFRDADLRVPRVIGEPVPLLRAGLLNLPPPLC